MRKNRNKYSRAFMIVGLVASVMCGGISGNIGQAEEATNQNIQAKVTAKEITSKLPMSGHWYKDEDGKTVYYHWKSIRVSGKWEKACYRVYMKQGVLEKKKIKFSSETKKYLKKIKGDRDLEKTVQWQDKKGNFFFAVKKYDKSKKTTQVLHKVDKKGNIVKKINLNKRIKITKSDDEAYRFYFGLYLDSVKEDTVIVKYEDSTKFGYLVIDRSTGQVIKQIAGGDDRDSFRLHTMTSTKLIGVDTDEKLTVADIPKEKKLTLPSGNKIKYAKVKSYVKGNTLPQEEDQRCFSFSTHKNNVYLLTAAGYYKVNTKDVSCEKIASTEDLVFIHQKAEVVYEHYLDYLTAKDYVMVDIIPLSDTEFYVVEGSAYDHYSTNYRKLWLCSIK